MSLFIFKQVPFVFKVFNKTTKYKTTTNNWEDLIRQTSALMGCFLENLADLFLGICYSIVSFF